MSVEAFYLRELEKTPNPVIIVHPNLITTAKVIVLDGDERFHLVFKDNSVLVLDEDKLTKLFQYSSGVLEFKCHNISIIAKKAILDDGKESYRTIITAPNSSWNENFACLRDITKLAL